MTEEIAVKEVSMRHILYAKKKEGIIEYDAQTDFVSPEGQRQIERILEKKYRHNINHELDPDGQYYPYLPDDWDWSWMVRESGARYQGTLPKRIAKSVKSRFYIKISEEDLSEIGNIAKLNTVPNAHYIFDIDDEMDWEDGDFGDHGSCFWHDRWGARNMLRDNGGMAIRFYKRRNGPMSRTLGYGRAWLVPDIPERGCVIVFNTYPANFRTVHIANLLSQIFDLSYKSIALGNEGSTDGLLYINCDGRLVGQEEKISRWESIDLGWSEDGYEWEDPDAYGDYDW